MDYYRKITKISEPRELSFSNHDIKNMHHNFYKNERKEKENINSFSDILSTEMEKVKTNRTI